MKNEVESCMPKVLTRKETALYLRISERTLDNKIVKTGKIRKFMAGDRSVRFFLVDINKYINEQLERNPDENSNKQ